MMTITILGRTFSVQPISSSRGVAYELTGERGAVYRTLRHATREELMFLVDKRKPTAAIPSGFEHVWLTDRDGSLKLAGAR